MQEKARIVMSSADQNSAVSLPDHIYRAIEACFPGQKIGPLEPTFGGYSNTTVIVPVGGERLVAKIAQVPIKQLDVRREATVLQAIEGRGLPAPTLVSFYETSDFCIEFLAEIEGINGMHFFSHEQRRLPELYAAVGRILSLVHQQHATGLPEEFHLRERYARVHAELPQLGLDPELVRGLQSAIEHPIWDAPADRLVHGDAGIHNLLWDGELRALLDWEWSGCGSPLFDLAWNLWTMRFRSLEPRITYDFLSAYQAYSSQPIQAKATELRALALSHVAFILTRSEPNTWTRAEWERRAIASFDFLFPDIEA
jgi:aminoglycoside phosphotransferase (APT) family kinase protein